MTVVVEDKVEKPDFMPPRFFAAGVNVVLDKNNDKEAWDSWGVRDCAILSDVQGNFVEDGNEMVMYFTGSSEQGKFQQTGRAVSKDSGTTWKKDPVTPVLKPAQHGWDSNIASSSWVIKVDGKYRMYYRGAGLDGDAIGLATSNDGIVFEKHASNPLITSEMFSGIRNESAIMGVVNAVEGPEGKIIVLFEAVESKFENRGQIFAAESADGISFAPLNEGKPLFSSREITTWPVKAVCNPRLIQLTDGWYLLGFNGCDSGDWSIGFAYTKDFNTWIEHPGNPVLVPRGWPETDPLSGRLEGPVIDRKALLDRHDEIKCYFMAIPSGARNHEGAVNVGAVLRHGEEGSLPRFKSLPASKDSIFVSGKTVQLTPAKEPSYFIQAHHVTDKGIRELVVVLKSIESGMNDGSVFMAISNNMNALYFGSGLLLKISGKGAFYKSEPYPLGLNGLFVRVLNRVSRLLGWINLSKEPGPRYGWKKIASLENSVCDSEIRLKIKDRNTVEFSMNKEKAELVCHNDVGDTRIVTFAAFKNNSEFTLKEVLC